MRTLVVGSGGREHALVWKLKQEKIEVYCAPGNGGISEDAVCYNAHTIDELVEFASERRIDLTIVGPEAYLAQGIVDAFEARGLKIFGPNAVAARLESSKVFAKMLMDRYDIPTARFRWFDDPNHAERYLERCEFPVVIKADGLAQGKGSYVVKDREDGFAVIDLLMRKKIFGQSGEKIVIEEFLEGKEMSLMVLSDGRTFVPLLSAMDYKKAHDGDRGPNTGGMGSIAPAPHYSEELWRIVKKEMLDKLLVAFEKESIVYKGVLYLGLMITRDGPRVLEFNCRFGDPETQAVLPLMRTNLTEVCLAAIEGSLSKLSLSWHDEKSVCVVLASGGYPGEYRVGFAIDGLDSAEGVLIFHAGTKKQDGKFVTSGGRVLNVCATGKTYEEARRKVYSQIEKIHFDGMHFRKDIGLV
ncbi:MAG: phosphoribosylamine--glycine ligase [Thermotoga caldifontis]|uniref:phosphoribosylamine--glycine ligase n=1 Tax=Thermotoga caldifontis TaxID=1508419 RepID=UPI003C7E763D